MLLSEAVGLWLGDGSPASRSEIVLTNNCWELIESFHDALMQKYPCLRPRVAVYSYDGTATIPVNLPVRIRKYTDTRASQPYYMWRAASVSDLHDWKSFVSEILMGGADTHQILRGFFAAEGSIKETQRSRVLRIAQLESRLVERWLSSIGLEWSYSQRGRTYELWGKRNWDYFAAFDLAGLHPQKRDAFWEAWLSIKEEHYSPGFLQENIYTELFFPRTSHSLAQQFRRSHARVYDALSNLRRKGVIQKYSVRSYVYWLRKDVGRVVISGRKLEFLRACMDATTTEIASVLRVSHRAAKRRLSELETHGLVTRKIDKRWTRTPGRKILVMYEKDDNRDR